MSSTLSQLDPNSGAFRHAAACDLLAVREGTLRLRLFLEASGVDRSDVNALELVCAEAANNAVRYAPDAARTLPVVIEAFLHTRGIELRITDHTAGFELPAEVGLPDHEMESGRGLFLICSVMDRVDYLRGRDENILIARRRLHWPGRRTPSSRELELERELAQMTEEMASAYESLSAIFRFSTELGGSERGAGWIEKWMHELCRVTGAEWFQFRLAERASRQLGVVASTATEAAAAFQAEDAAAAHFAEARAITGRQDVWFGPQHPLSQGDPLLAFGTRMSGVVHPIFVGADAVGVLTLGRETASDPFTAGQVNIIHTLADFLGIEVCNALAQEENLRARVLHRELEIASGIQQSLLPVTIPQLPRLAVAARATTASEMGGDFYDVIEVPGGGLLLVIADVMGKGTSAALFAAIFRSQLRARLDLAAQPEVLLAWLNRALFADLDRVDMFITAMLVLVDAGGRRLRLASAGHCPLLLADDQGAAQESLGGGPPLGIDPTAAFQGADLPLPAGGTGILFTDGVPEMANAAGELFGMGAFKAWWSAQARPTRDPAELGCALLAELDAYRGPAPARDDVAFIIFHAHPTSP